MEATAADDEVCRQRPTSTRKTIAAQRVEPTLYDLLSNDDQCMDVTLLLRSAGFSMGQVVGSILGCWTESVEVA